MTVFIVVFYIAAITFHFLSVTGHIVAFGILLQVFTAVQVVFILRLRSVSGYRFILSCILSS